MGGDTGFASFHHLSSRRRTADTALICYRKVAVNAGRQGRTHLPEHRVENSWLINGRKGCYRQESFAGQRRHLSDKPAMRPGGEASFNTSERTPAQYLLQQRSYLEKILQIRPLPDVPFDSRSTLFRCRGEVDELLIFPVQSGFRCTPVRSWTIPTRTQVLPVRS